MMDRHNFVKYLENPSGGMVTEIAEMLDKYPFCQTLQLLHAKIIKVAGSKDIEETIKHTAVFLNDKKRFYRYLNDIIDEAIVQQPTAVYKLVAEENEMQRQNNPQIELIDKFLDKKPVFHLKTEVQTQTEDQVYDPELVSETLAEIYLKQGKTELALNTYNKLCLKFPEKSSYFAARIEKINQEIKNNN